MKIEKLMIVFIFLSLVIHFSKSQIIDIKGVTEHKYFGSTKFEEERIENIVLTLSVQEQKEEKEPIAMPGREFIISLDNSGSMSGNPIRNALKSIENLVEEMNENDYIHLITFSSESDIVFQDMKKENKDEILDYLATVRAQGSTNLYSSLLDVESILGSIKTRENTIKKLFLFSDGEVNTGETRDSIIFDKVKTIKEVFQCSVSAFGVGDHFNERLMMNIAEFGEGNYFFLENKNEEIQRIVKIAVSAANEVIGSYGKLSFIVDQLEKTPGIEVIKVYGFKIEENNIIKIGDLRNGETLKFLVQIKINKGYNGEGKINASTGELELITVELSFFNEIKKEKEFKSITISVPISDNEEKLKEKNNKVSAIVKMKEIQTKYNNEIQMNLDSDEYERAKNQNQEMLDSLDEILTDFETLEEEDDDIDVNDGLEWKEIIKETITQRKRTQKLKRKFEDKKTTRKTIKLSHGSNQQYAKTSSQYFEEL